MSNECRFEPDIIELRCLNCDAPTTERGTCADETLCATCREDWESDPRIGKVGVAELMVGVAEKSYGSFRANYIPNRAIHALQEDGVHIMCNSRGGPHPTSVIPERVTCRRCRKKLELV